MSYLNLALGVWGTLPQNTPQPVGTGETITFWIIAPLMVICGIGVVLSRKAVHAAVAMVGLMVCLSVMYMAQDAQFLAVVQIVVYTGAIMMLILFVIMMLGVAASDKYRNTAFGLRLGAWIMGGLAAVALVTTLVLALPYQVFQGYTLNPAPPQSITNPESLAVALFTRHYFTIELVACLLIVAAIGAMTLTHPDRLRKKFSQKEVAEHKMEVYGSHRTHPGQLPQPGVYATSNAVDVPTISGETGEPIRASIPRVVRIRGAERSLGQVAPQFVRVLQKERERKAEDPTPFVEVPQSGQFGMGGPALETSLRQMTREVVRAEDVDEPPAEDAASSETEEKKGEQK